MQEPQPLQTALGLPSPLPAVPEPQASSTPSRQSRPRAQGRVYKGISELITSSPVPGKSGVFPISAAVLS